MNSIDSLSKKDHQVNGDYLSLALCTACIDISASTSNATILMGWEFKIYLAAKNLVPAKNSFSIIHINCSDLASSPVNLVAVNAMCGPSDILYSSQDYLRIQISK